MLQVAIEVKRLNELLFWVRPLSTAEFQRILLAPMDFCDSPLRRLD